MKTLNFRHNRIICIGDTHSMEVLLDILIHKIPENSDVWMCGDLGIGFGKISYSVDNAKSYLMSFNKRCLQKNINLYITRGNHDAPYPSIWETVWSNVFMLATGDVGVFPNGKTALFIGGGISVDRVIRKQGESYWHDEITEPLKDVPKVDYCLMHDAPEEFNHPTATLPNSYMWYVDRDPELMYDCYKQRALMSRICEESGAKFLIGGHFHNSVNQEDNGVGYRCLDISELWEFNTEFYGE